MNRPGWTTTAFVLSMILAACSNGDPPTAPQVERIEPADGDLSKRTELRVRGADIFVRTTSDLDTEVVVIDAAFEVVLLAHDGGAEILLEDVRYLDSSTLSAVLPAGAAAGWYAAEVRGPYGSGARLWEAFKVYSDLDEDSEHDDLDTCVDADGDGFGRAGYDRSGCPHASIDLDDENGSLCADTDGDGCEDCSSGSFQPAVDGTDLDGDGYCALGDCDDSPLSGSLCGNSCTTFYFDADGDGLGGTDSSFTGCVAPLDYVDDASDCNDANDQCTSDCTDEDGDSSCVTHDCDDSVATGASCSAACNTFFVDADGDGFGDPSNAVSACAQPVGSVANSTDCADLTGPDPACGGLPGASCAPGLADDLCNAIDNDCDANIDEDFVPSQTSCGVGACSGNVGALTCAGGVESDSCDPLAGAAADDATCDGVDDDCDNQIDENPSIAWFEDADGDGFGNVAATTLSCSQPAGFTSDSSDCDDDPLLCGSSCFPGNTSLDLCDGFNQDCDGSTDEDVVGWWDLDWQFRRRLDMDNSGQPETLTDFPVLVVLDLATFDYGNAAADGSDIRFVDDDGLLELTHHVELWNPAGKSYLWVQVPVIDASSTADHFWLYYGALSSVPDTQDESGTYDANYVGVWHLDETSGAHVDSAAGISCSWIGGGLGTQDAVGQIGGANDFDGDEDGATCGTNQIADTNASTITAWVNLALTGDPDQEIVALELDALPYRGLGLMVRTSDGALGKYFGSGFKYGNNVDSRVVANEWTFVAIRSVKSGSGVIEVSKNGGPWETIVSGNTNDLAIQPSAPLVLGKWLGSLPNEATRGRIDEIQISNVARSDSWVRAQHLSSSSAFVNDTGQELQCP